ncbi:hypothetical protein Fmac_005284 [Flemingia macrophylla]|uniref:Uncharacterized protein n=1 Tax=Flemingia macrophylla TaxID=520843 RepID=A0ABD1N7E5_9FABA
MSEVFCSDCKRQTEVVFDHSGGDTSGDNDPIRVDGPTNPLITDGGLSTVITKPNDGSGEFLSSSLGRCQNRGSNPDPRLQDHCHHVRQWVTECEQGMRGLRNLEVWKLGVVNYLDALKQQEKLALERKLHRRCDTLLSLQHPLLTPLAKGKPFTIC